jgi:hypothetical protein
VRSLLLLCLLASPALAQEEIPLEAPKKKITIQKTKPAALGLVLGVKAGAAFATDPNLSPSVLAAIELGYRFPVWERRLGVSIEPSFANPQTQRATEAGTAKGPAFALSIPVLLTLNVALGPGLVRAMAGPSIEWAAIDVKVSSFVFNERVLGLGAQLSAGYLFRLGPGGLGLELRYRVSPLSIASRTFLSHAIGVTAAYVFLL